VSRNTLNQFVRTADRDDLDIVTLTACGQAIYYALTGVWSLVSIKTFQKVTGPKVDTWLVKTVGTLVLVIGGVLGMAAKKGRVTPEIALLATGSAAGLAAIDVVYATKRRISPIYLLDALAEVGLIALWAMGWKLRQGGDGGDGKGQAAVKQ
jgi:hypothetical protein